MRKVVQVGHQEVTGTVTCEPWTHPVLILAEEWPSLAFAAQATGCLDITTWCSFKSGKSKVEFTLTRLGSTLTSVSLDILAARYAIQHGDTVLIQGCTAFANQMQSWVEGSVG